MTLRQTTDVNYLTARLESNSLVEDGIALIAGPDVNLPGDPTLNPQIISTGSSLTYLRGQYAFANPIAADTLIATLPQTRGTLAAGIYLASFRPSSPSTSRTPVSLSISGNQIKTTDQLTPGAGGAELALDGIVYLSE